MSSQPHRHRKAYNIPGHIHELTFTCYRRYRFLEAQRTRSWLTEAVVESLAKHDFALYAYVFMPEHVHLIVHPRQRHYDISDFLHDVKAPVGRQAISYLEQCDDRAWLERLTRQRGQRTEHLFWQSGGGYDRNVMEWSTLRSMIDYLHNNPVRRGLVTQAIDWQWSSAGWYILGKPGPLPVDPVVV